MKNIIFSAATLLLMSGPALAATDADCAAMWVQADINTDGALDAAESERYSAMMRIAEKTMPADGMINEAMFKENCMSGVFTTAATDVSAPLEGANSFTESQAKDRIIAAEMSAPSTLAKDDKGVWRGTAMKNGQPVKVAVDFKGNVVSE